MAITYFLLESNFNYNSLLQKPFRLPSFSRSFSTKSPCAHNITLKRNYSCYKTISISPKFRTKCFIIDHNPDDEKGFGGNRGGEDHDLKKVAVESGMNKVLQIPIVTGILLGLWLLYDHHHIPLALAASGGRMGGRSSRRSSRSSTRSSSSSSSSYRSSSRPSYSSSSDGTYWTQTSSPVHVTSETEPGLGECLVVVLFLALAVCACFTRSPNTIKTSVLKLQVGLLGTGRSLQGDLNKIAEIADTSTSKGLSYVLQEATLALLRNLDYCISGYSSVDVKRKEHEGEKLFDQFSIEERGKFDEETLVNVNNVKRRSPTSHNSNGLRNEYIVVTIIVAASGAAEVLWSPQKEDDSLTEEECRQDYPLLHPL